MQSWTRRASRRAISSSASQASTPTGESSRRERSGRRCVGRGLPAAARQSRARETITSAGCTPRPIRSAALQALAREWRWELDPRVVGITGSTGKTSVKDITTHPPAVPDSCEPRELQHRDRPAAGDPRRASAGHRGAGSRDGDAGIAGRSRSCARSRSRMLAVITNVGPVHLELLGTLEAIAEAKAEILEGLGPEGRASCRPTPRLSSRTWRHPEHAHVRPRR